MNLSVSVRSTATDRALFKKMLLLLSLSLTVLISLYIFVFAPLYVWLSNDVLYMGTVLPDVFEVLCSTVDILVFGLSYGVILFALYRFPFKKALVLVYVYIASIFYKYVGNLLMTYITDGVPKSGVFSDLLNVGFYILLELLQAGIVLLIGAKILTTAKQRESIRLEAAKKAQISYEPSAEYLPFSRLLNLKNPLQGAAFWMAFVPMIVHVLQRVYFDILLTVSNGFYGNPLIDILWMLLYYTLDVVAYGVIVYFIEILLVSKLGDVGQRLDNPSEDETNELLGA